MKNLFIKIIITLFVFLVTFTVCNADNTDNNSDLSELIVKKAQIEYNNAQFLVEIAASGNQQYVKEYLFIIDHSIYEINVETWNAFCANYKNVRAAIHYYNCGWDIEFDDILN